MNISKQQLADIRSVARVMIDGEHHCLCNWCAAHTFSMTRADVLQAIVNMEDLGQVFDTREVCGFAYVKMTGLHIEHGNVYLTVTKRSLCSL